MVEIRTYKDKNGLHHFEVLFKGNILAQSDEGYKKKKTARAKAAEWYTSLNTSMICHKDWIVD